MKTKKPASYRRRFLGLALFFLVTLALYCLTVGYCFTPYHAVWSQIERATPIGKTELVFREPIELDPWDQISPSPHTQWQLRKSGTALLAVTLDRSPLGGWYCMRHNLIDVATDVPFSIATLHADGPVFLFGQISDPYVTEITLTFHELYDWSDPPMTETLTFSTRDMKVQDGDYYFFHETPFSDGSYIYGLLAEVTLTDRDGTAQHYPITDKDAAIVRFYQE